MIKKVLFSGGRKKGPKANLVGYFVSLLANLVKIGLWSNWLILANFDQNWSKLVKFGRILARVSQILGILAVVRRF